MAGSIRRSAILESAIAEFSARGYHGARIERIAASARANKQLIFHYFGSKDGLYEAAVANLLPQDQEESAPAQTPLDALKGCIAGIAAWLAENPGAALALAECAPGSELPGGALRLASEWTDRQVGMLQAALEDGQRKGFFRDDIDAQSIADVTLASLVGWAVTRKGRPPDGARFRRPAAIGQIVADYCSWR